MEKDGRSSAMSEGEGLDEEDDDGDDDEEGGAETEEQSGNESEMNEQEEDVSLFVVPVCVHVGLTWHRMISCINLTDEPWLWLVVPQEGSENEEEEREEEEEENTDYLTDSNKENETDEENNVRLYMSLWRADKRYSAIKSVQKYL